MLAACTYSTNTFKVGESIYSNFCSSCHGMNAEGLGDWYPSLLNPNLSLGAERKFLASKIKFGISLDSMSYIDSKYRNTEMPANTNFNEIDICNLLNYLNSKYWKGEAFTIQEVKYQLNSVK